MNNLFPDVKKNLSNLIEDEETVSKEIDNTVDENYLDKK